MSPRRRPRAELTLAGAAWRGLWHAGAASAPIVAILVVGLMLADALAR